MNTEVPKIIAIHDLSCFGRASLTVVIPIISAMGIQVCPVPTALLSTHTGGFENFTFMDLTRPMEEILIHWKELKLEFSAIYSGFLGSEKQVEIVEKYIAEFKKKGTLVIVDSVMADEGELYSTMTPKMIEKMKILVGKADVITPNLTEAAFLLGEEYREEISTEELKEWLRRLAELGPSKIVITSIHNRKRNSSGVVGYEQEHGYYWKLEDEHLPLKFPGTGDIFASVLTGALLQRKSFPEAMARGVGFIIEALKESRGVEYPVREGVLLEKVIPLLNSPQRKVGFTRF